MVTVTKKELAYRISESTGLKKVVIKRIIQSFIDEIIDELAQGNRLEFREFGVFEIKERAARRARNPRTGVPVTVPAKRVVHFKAGRLMKERVQDQESQQVGGDEAASTTASPTESSSMATPATPPSAPGTPPAATGEQSSAEGAS